MKLSALFENESGYVLEISPEDEESVSIGVETTSAYDAETLDGSESVTFEKGADLARAHYSKLEDDEDQSARLDKTLQEFKAKTSGMEYSVKHTGHQYRYGSASFLLLAR